MVDKRLEKLAKLCVHFSVDVKPKEMVRIRGSAQGSPLMGEIYKECLLCGAYPTLMPDLDFVEYVFYKYSKDHQLEFVSPFVKFIVENIDVDIYVFSNPNPKNLTSIAPEKIRKRMASAKEVRDIFMKRYGEGKLRWTIVPYPISAQAQEAAMSLTEYEDFVYSSCLVDKSDPIAKWKEIRRQQEKTCERLNKTSEIRIVGEDTDLTFSVMGRKWISCDGRINMPDGEVYTSPVENSANGKIRFTYPGIYSSKEVEDVTLTFKEGKVSNASAAKGSELLKEILKTEGADRIGETAIGTNYGITKFTKEILFDEKMGGTIHVALGLSYPEAGGLNKSAIHWDLLKDMKKGGEIYADGKLFYKNGKFIT